MSRVIPHGTTSRRHNPRTRSAGCSRTANKNHQYQNQRTHMAWAPRCTCDNGSAVRLGLGLAHTGGTPQGHDACLDHHFPPVYYAAFQHMRAGAMHGMCSAGTSTCEAPCTHMMPVSMGHQLSHSTHPKSCNRTPVENMSASTRILRGTWYNGLKGPAHTAEHPPTTRRAATRHQNSRRINSHCKGNTGKRPGSADASLLMGRSGRATNGHEKNTPHLVCR